MYRNKVWYTLHPEHFYNEILSWVIEIWMENHLINDNNNKIVHHNVQCSLQGVANEW